MADRARCILLIFWHATLSPCPAFISLRRLYPPLRYSLSPPPSPRKLSSAILPRRARARDWRESFPPSARSREVSPRRRCRPFLSISFLSFSCIHISHIHNRAPSLDASSSTSVLLLRLPCSVFRSPLARVLLAHRDLAATLFFCPVRSRPPSVRGEYSPTETRDRSGGAKRTKV